MISIPLTIRMHVKEDIGDAYFSVPAASVSHSRIEIVGNGALDSFCSGQGTDGLSWATAHVIENFEIDAGGSGHSGILIINTDRFLIIRNCTVINAQRTQPVDIPAGIKVTDCNNVNITNCNTTNNLWGINMWTSAYISVSDNIATNNDHGIIVTCSNHITISDNIASHNKEGGITIVKTADIDADYNTISGNNVMYNDEHGICLAGSNYNTISGNNASHNVFNGISIQSSGNNKISGNNASYNLKYGVHLNAYSDNNEIYENILCDNTEGDIRDLGEDNDIHDNGCPTAEIPGYPLVWILGFVLCGFTVLFRKTLKKSKKYMDLNSNYAGS